MKIKSSSATEIILNFSQNMYLEFVSIDRMNILVLIAVVDIERIYVLR
jgi:hypothetical protein